MEPVWQIPRPALFWLLFTEVALAGLHADHLTLWLLGAGALVLGWRVQIYRGVWHYPGPWAKAVLVLMCGGAILASYGRLYGLEPMVALLWSGFILKLLEMQRRRDALILVCLGYFVAVTQCLFSQTPGTALGTLGGVLLVTVVLAALHRRAEAGYWRPVRTAAALLAEAVPLMLILFLVMPRLGSLWTVPQPRQGAIGVSDVLAPGDLSRLGASGEVAFRVKFDGTPPPHNQLYWRGLVLSRFDGRNWSRIEPGLDADAGASRRGGAGPQPWESAVQRLGAPRHYRMILEPSGENWLFALETPVPESPDVTLNDDLTLTRATPVASRWSHSLTSWMDYRAAAGGLGDGRRALETMLPGVANPRTRELAARWRGEVDSDAALVERVLALYNRDYVYSLEAPLLGRDSVDEFLWRTRRGFCEHFAGSFVFIMRAAGVPARVVVGYQGGEYHPDASYLTVHQYDAHAWAEVWLAGRGWVRVDPTAAVAPERIEFSVADLLGGERAFLADSPLSLVRFRGIRWLDRLRLQLDYYDYLWAQWVLGYEYRQERLLTGWLGAWDPWRLGFFILGAGALALLPVLFGQLRLARRPPRPPLERLFERYCRQLARRGVTRAPGEAPRALAERVARERPALGTDAAAISALLEEGLYGGGEPDLADLRQRIRRLG
ncbi:MAG: DUF3488 domain-containing transglutaminase family protein [Gammaproteobacteria bacterium]|nr:DUF3488 domain-containing transglutaminase family protein [Gammaproteobacteria bacterium]